MEKKILYRLRELTPAFLIDFKNSGFEMHEFDLELPTFLNLVVLGAVICPKNERHSILLAFSVIHLYIYFFSVYPKSMPIYIHIFMRSKNVHIYVVLWVYQGASVAYNIGNVSKDG